MRVKRDIYVFTLLEVENVARKCLLQRQRERKYKTRERMQETKHERKEENKSQIGKCQRDESFPQ